MNANILDIYTDYLICQNKYATATGLSDMLSGDISHDKITRFLSSGDFGSDYKKLAPILYSCSRHYLI
jgi:hypothetical protein